MSTHLSKRIRHKIQFKTVNLGKTVNLKKSSGHETFCQFFFLWYRTTLLAWNWMKISGYYLCIQYFDLHELHLEDNISEGL